MSTCNYVLLLCCLVFLFACRRFVAWTTLLIILLFHQVNMQSRQYAFVQCNELQAIIALD